LFQNYHGKPRSVGSSSSSTWLDPAIIHRHSWCTLRTWMWRTPSAAMLFTAFPVQVFHRPSPCCIAINFVCRTSRCDDFSPPLKTPLRLFSLALWKRRWRYTETSVSAVLASDLLLYATDLFWVDIIYYVYTYWKTSRCSWPTTL